MFFLVLWDPFQGAKFPVVIIIMILYKSIGLNNLKKNNRSKLHLIVVFSIVH